MADVHVKTIFGNVWNDIRKFQKNFYFLNVHFFFFKTIFLIYWGTVALQFCVASAVQQSE